MMQYAVFFISVLKGLMMDRLLILTAPAIRMVRKDMELSLKSAFCLNNDMFEQYLIFLFQFLKKLES